VKALEPERVDRLAAETAEPRPRVVEVGWTVGEAEPGQVERDSAQAAGGELVEHLAVQEARRGDAVEAHDRLAGAGLAHEAVDPARGEAPARRSVGSDHGAGVG